MLGQKCSSAARPLAVRIRRRVHTLVRLQLGGLPSYSSVAGGFTRGRLSHAMNAVRSTNGPKWYGCALHFAKKKLYVSSVRLSYVVCGMQLGCMGQRCYCLIFLERFAPLCNAVLWFAEKKFVFLFEEVRSICLCNFPVIDPAAWTWRGNRKQGSA